MILRFIFASFFCLNLSAMNPQAAGKPVLATLTPQELTRDHCEEKDIDIEFVVPIDDQTEQLKFRHAPIKTTAQPNAQPGASCSSTINTNDAMGNFSASPTHKMKIKSRGLLNDAICNDEGNFGQRELCIYNSDNKLIAFAGYSFETRQASITDILDVKASNGEVSFTIEAVGGKDVTFVICHGLKSLGDINAEANKTCPAPWTKVETKDSKVSILNLDRNNPQSFRVGIKQKDDIKWLKFFEATPSTVDFPLNGYNGAGGEAEFGCNQTGASAWMLIFTLVALGLWRYKKTSLGMLLVLGFITINPQDAHADLGQMSIGILGAMYRPDLDNEILSNGQRVNPFYRNHFRKNISDNDGPINPLMGAEFDWHLWDGFGSLQLGFGVSYAYVKGRGVKIVNGSPDLGNINNDASAALHMYQLRPQLTYIFNPFVEYFPLAPYVRGAFVAHGYTFTHDGKDAGSAKVKPSGFRFGYQAAVGLMLMLDFLEPSAVVNARSGHIFEHVYLKGELSYTKIDSFGAKGFQFSPKDVMGTGLPLMWTFGLVFDLPN